jgi:hypothetical protein
MLVKIESRVIYVVEFEKLCPICLNLKFAVIILLTFNALKIPLKKKEKNFRNRKIFWGTTVHGLLHMS